MARTLAAAALPSLPKPRACTAGRSAAAVGVVLVVEPVEVRGELDVTGAAILLQQQLRNLYGVAGAAALEWRVTGYEAARGEVGIATDADAVPFLRTAVAAVTTYNGGRIALRWAAPA